MKLLPRKSLGFTLVELLVCLVIVGVLVLLAFPRGGNICISSGQMTGTLNNARQLHLATQTMSLDTFSTENKIGMEWTMMASHGKTTPAALATYFDALVENNYLSKSDLKKLLTAPGKSPSGDLTADNICFKFFQVNEESPSDQPLVVTANWEPTGLTRNAPYGKKGFVVFNKGGSGGIYRRLNDVTSTNIFPVGSVDGHSYRYVTLK